MDIRTHFGLLSPQFSILDVNNTHLNSRKLQTSAYILFPHLTSQALALSSNVPSTQAQASVAHIIFLLTITSSMSNAANVIHGLNNS